MITITYDNLRERLKATGVELPPSEAEVTQQQIDNSITGRQVRIDVPELPKISIPMEDLAFESNIPGVVKNELSLNTLLGIKPGQGGKVNNYAGSQLLLNSDRIILNSRLDYLMLFGKEGVSISSQGNVNIDADDAITIYGEDGLFLGVPGKGKSLSEGGGNQKPPVNKSQRTIDSDYEPLVLGIKLAGLLEDLIYAVKDANIVCIGGAYFREDTQQLLSDLQKRIPEMLSTYAFIDGISHETVLPESPRITSVTPNPTSLTGTILGVGEVGNVTTPNTVTNPVTNPLAAQADFFEAETIEGEPPL